MTTNNSGTTNNSSSATIYTFPPRGRFANPNQLEDVAPAANIALPRGVMIASGGGWYHEEAIQAEIQAQRGRKN